MNVTGCRTLFLGWRDPQAHRWYPVGRLDVSTAHPQFSFGYTHGAQEAAERSGFVPLYDFPDFYTRYTSSWLFPLFKNRVMNNQRRSYREYLSFLDIDDATPDPLEILAVDGGYRATDHFQVFPWYRNRRMVRSTVVSFCTAGAIRTSLPKGGSTLCTRRRHCTSRSSLPIRRHGSQSRSRRRTTT